MADGDNEMMEIEWIGCRESTICCEGNFEDGGSVTSAIVSGSHWY